MSLLPIATLADPILVTGSNGFIGARVVEALLRRGYTNLRCFIRPSSHLEKLDEVIDRHHARGTVRFISGDLLSAEDCIRAAQDVTVVYHLAAGFDKSFAGAFLGSAVTTRNLIEAFLRHGTPKRLVNVSSFAVYSNFQMKRGALLDENAPLEDAHQERYNPYGFGKLKQEEIVRDYGTRRNLPYVILRPGAVFGPGSRALSGRIGTDAFGIFIHVSSSNVLPLTYVDNCAEAIVLAGLVPGIDGEIFNVVDDDLPTSKQVLEAYRRKVSGFRSIPLPYPVAYGLSAFWEFYSRRTQGQLPPAFNRRRCSADWKSNRYSNAKLSQALEWKPRIDMKTALSNFLGQFEKSAT
jgi:nucleoside-diphosphate-sugar epimerase